MRRVCNARAGAESKAWSSVSTRRKQGKVAGESVLSLNGSGRAEEKGSRLLGNFVRSQIRIKRESSRERWAKKVVGRRRGVVV